MRLALTLSVASMLLLLWPSRADAVPIVSTDPSAVVSLAPGTMTMTITFSITPDADGVKGFALFFSLSDAASVVVLGCSSLVDSAPVCPAGGASFNFAVLDFTPIKTGAFAAGSVDLQIPATAILGAALTLTSQSTITEGNFAELVLSQNVVAQVVPEPATSLIMGLGLASLAIYRRGGAARLIGEKQ